MVRGAFLFPAILAFMVVVVGPAFAQGDAGAGERFVAIRCMACHSFEEGKNKEGGGPSLYKVFGRTAGRIEEFEYSPSYKQAGDKGLVWNEETLLDYVKDPKKFLRAYLDDPNAKSRMAVKFPEEADRQNVIAYLKSLSE